jgi:hypothetical protein
VIEVNKTPTLFQFEYSGLTKAGPSIFYQDANCVGQAYLNVQHPPTMGIWLGAGEEVYYPGRPALVTVVSFQLILSTGPDGCATSSPRQIYGAPLLSAILRKFEPPLCVSAENVKCQ